MSEDCLQLDESSFNIGKNEKVDPWESYPQVWYIFRKSLLKAIVYAANFMCPQTVRIYMYHSNAA